MSRKAILVASFGTSYNETRVKTIEAIERQIGETFPGYEIRRAFTSRMIIRKLKERDGLHVDYVTEAMDRLSAEGFEQVIVQPTHIINGEEYDDIVRIVSEHVGRIADLRMGKPLLTTEEDYDNAVEAIRECLVPLAGGRDLVLMGHGTSHYSNAAYCQLQMKLVGAGLRNVFVTTVEGYPGFGDTVGMMREHGCRGAVTVPFMVVAGDHAQNDMAGDEEDSLKSILASEGFEVECVVRGLGEFAGFRKLFIDHVRHAIEKR
ncbi:MAG: sirohydrochlorin cobaltochelatase [Thermoplasmata archaeon]|nr:sirohydrochlorin cobaltochelatase [Thermoplasmata archaeon]